MPGNEAIVQDDIQEEIFGPVIYTKPEVQIMIMQLLITLRYTHAG